MSREMKDSGIAWIGEIPKGWKVGKVKHFYQFITGFTPDTKKDYYYDENGIPWVTISDLSGKFIEETKMGISQKYIELNNPIIVPQNSLLYSFKLSVGQVARTKFELYTNEAIASFLHKDNISLDYLYYSSQICIIQNANENIYGAKLLNQNLISNAIIIFPPLLEQQKIAEFLDRKCGEIDELVALQEKMIEELTAYKQSVITEAVTKGLNPNAPMKDSGIAWIGEIPKEWNVIKFFRICSIITDFVASGSFESLRVNVPYLDFPDYAMLVRTIDLSGKGKASEKVYISKHSYDFLKNSNLFGGEIILPNIGASVGDVYIVPQLYEKMSLAPNSIMFKTISYDKYWYYYFFSKAGKQAIFDICQSTAQSKFNKTDLRNIKVCVPSLLEQQQIADYLDKKCAEIDELVAMKQQKIETLKEYKKSLIYEYVTGKKEVI